jgi:hypothetical protein
MRTPRGPHTKHIECGPECELTTVADMKSDAEWRSELDTLKTENARLRTRVGELEGLMRRCQALFFAVKPEDHRWGKLYNDVAEALAASPTPPERTAEPPVTQASPETRAAVVAMTSKLGASPPDRAESAKCAPGECKWAIPCPGGSCVPPPEHRTLPPDRKAP